jgi:hypothetical protein
MTLIEKILAIYPELANYNFYNGDIALQNDGAGDYIAKWEHPTFARPTEAELNTPLPAEEQV